jgi:organic hydroperoxide reductase OsmC/OhrA
MSTYSATISWRREGDFLKGHYSRLHAIAFDGGVELAGSASPHNVPLPYAVEAAADPEELFVASLSTCHMLWFLDYARRAGIVVEGYVDAAEGVMAKGADGRIAMTLVTLRPVVSLAEPSRGSELAALHHLAHDACFIANSVKTEVRIEPR